MSNRAGTLLSVVLALTGCCMEVVDGQGSVGITSATTGGVSGTTGGCARAGSCGNDGDCIVAYCASAFCGGCDHFAVSKALLSESSCLAEIGAVDGPTTEAPAACQDVPTERCGCPAHPYCVPRCSSGTCECADAGF